MTEWYRMKTGYKDIHNSSELSVETEMSDSFKTFANDLSPIPASVVPRKLDFTRSDDEDLIENASTNPVSLSPPYKRVRALTLFDKPHTPRTLLSKCSTPTHPQHRNRLFPPKPNLQSGTPSGSSNHLHPPSFEDSALGSFLPDDSVESKRPALVNINPFTPDGQALNRKKRALSKTADWDSSPEQPAKKTIKLTESNIPRSSEFVELRVIGRGEFGEVTACLNKLDGCVYAVKRSLKPVAGSAAERRALTEVYAHAVLGQTRHVVRYFSAWAEDNHMVIQNEFCAGGSLQRLIESGPLPESELLILLAHIADGLEYIHSQQLVHMDVKPGNIFISREDTACPPSDDSDDDEPIRRPTNSYKIGDLGHVTCLSDPRVEEGDCRYLPREVLQEDFSRLTKADIFAFGLTLYEAAGGGPLPQNGPQWHDFRDGKLPDLPNLSREFNDLIKRMIHPDPSQRPSAARLRRQPALRRPSRAQLQRELDAARMRIRLLDTKVQEAKCIKLQQQMRQPNIPLSQDNKVGVGRSTRSAKRLQPTGSGFRTRSGKPRDSPVANTASPMRADRKSTRSNTKKTTENEEKI